MAAEAGTQKHGQEGGRRTAPVAPSPGGAEQSPVAGRARAPLDQRLEGKTARITSAPAPAVANLSNEVLQNVAGYAETGPGCSPPGTMARWASPSNKK